MISTAEDGVAIEMTAGRFSVQGAPINSVTWAVSKNDDVGALLTFDAIKESTVSDSYLTDAFQVIASGFAAFVCGGLPHG